MFVSGESKSVVKEVIGCNKMRNVILNKYTIYRYEKLSKVVDILFPIMLTLAILSLIFMLVGITR
jgi:hypothetical protein